MCGIFGIWNTDGRPVDLAAVHRATSALRHRGPDDEGYLLVDTRSGRTVLCGGEHTAHELALLPIGRFMGEPFDLAFGFRRLAILDLSPAGHQPMAGADRKSWIIFNGEIYNFLELRAELAALGHSFHTGCDTEVILAAYQQWGRDCLSRFNGMWAMAIWDGAKRQLFAARDRFGVKPFYTTAPGGTFAFASEIKALIVAGAVPFRPAAVAVARYVAQGGFPGHQAGETMFEGVRALPAAHYLLVSGERWQPHRFWSLPGGEEGQGAQPSQACDEYRELFVDAVRLRLRADVPVGTCLSGGVDSSSIVAAGGRLMQTEHAVSLERLGEHQQTFSAVYESAGPWNERPYMEQVIARTRAAGNFVYPTEERLWRELERLVWHQDEPFQSTSIFAQWCVMDLARQSGVTVLLDGQGADELLGGYRPFATFLSHLLRQGRPRDAWREARAIRAATGLDPRSLLLRALALQLPEPLLARRRTQRLAQAAAAAALAPEMQEQLLGEQRARPASYVGQRNLDEHLADLLLEDSLPNLLRYEDRNSMAFSIEARVPFLDYRLAEYVFKEAGRWRIHQGWTKWIQRKAVEDLLPAEVVWRRDKVGFETPEQQWLRAGKDHLLELVSADATGSEYLDLPRVRRELPALLDRPGGAPQVWRWVNLVLWLRAFSTAAPGAGATPAREQVVVSAAG